MADADDVFGIEIAHHKPRDVFVLRHVFKICFVLMPRNPPSRNNFCAAHNLGVGAPREIRAAVSRGRSGRRSSGARRAAAGTAAGPAKGLGRSLRVHDGASGSRTRGARLPESHEQAAAGAAPSKPKIATYGPCRNPIASAPSSGRKLTTKPNSAHQATRNRISALGEPAVERRSQQRGENSDLVGQQASERSGDNR